MTNGPTVDRNRRLRLLGALVGLSAGLGACTYAPEAIITGGVPDDYRLRHPIAITEDCIVSNGAYAVLRSNSPVALGAGPPQVVGELEYYARITACFKFQ